MRYLFLILLLQSCGTAKTEYIDTKYNLCRKGCDLKYSRYESQKYSQCLQRCAQKRTEDTQ